MITEDGNIKYDITEDIMNLISDEFLKEFRKQLFRIHEHYSLKTTEDDGLLYSTGTSGWYASLGRACIETKNKELLKYYKTLPWYDSDLFDSQLADMIVSNKLMLAGSKEIISEKLGIKEEELHECDNCGGIYTSDMVVASGEDVSCFNCIDKNNSDNRNVTDYYVESFRLIDDWISEGESDD